MTTAQIEQRLLALEQSVAEIRVQLAKPPEALSEEDIIPGAEYELITKVPPKAVFYIPAKLVLVETPPPLLGLSPEEWASLPLDDEEE